MDLDELRRLAGVEINTTQQRNYSKKNTLNEDTVSLTKDRHEITGPADRKFILVQDPMGKESEPGDMIAVVDGTSFAQIFIGAHGGLKYEGMADTPAKEHWILYHFNQMDKALADANKRLKKAGIDSVVTESAMAKRAITGDVKHAFAEVIASLAADAKKAKDHDMKALYHSDAAKYEKVRDLLVKGKINDATKAFRDMDTACSDVIFDPKVVKSKETRRHVADLLGVELLKETCGLPHGEDEEMEIPYATVLCPHCRTPIRKDEFFDHMSCTHPEMMGMEVEPAASEDEEGSRFAKGDKVHHNGMTCVVVVPNGRGDLVGVAPEGQENNKEAVKMVHSKELTKVEDEEDYVFQGNTMGSTSQSAAMMGMEGESKKEKPMNEAKSEDATITYAAPEDKDESPDDVPADTDQKIDVPAKVLNALKKEIKELRDAAQNMSNDNYTRNFYNDTADAFDVILDHLEKKNVHCMKMAQIHTTKLMSPMIHKLPDVVFDFISRGGAPETLNTLFKKVKERK